MSPKKDELSPEELRELDRAEAKEAAKFGPEKTYELAPGDYAGRIGEAEGIISVPSSGKVTTSVLAEQGFLEGPLGAEGKLTKEGQKDVEEQAQAQADEPTEE